MLLVELKERIKEIKAMLTELVQEGEITQDEAKLIAPVVIAQCIKNSVIEFE